MKISEKELALASESTEFRKETLEKVWRLMGILDGVFSHTYLKNRFALKGGTALNLFFLNLPRLSVDIDLNYIGSADKGIMAQERPEVEHALEAIFNRLNITAVRVPTSHAGGKWRLRYESALVSGSKMRDLEVDVNYMYRVPLWKVDNKRSISVGGRQTNFVTVLALEELAAGKLSALFNRNASRDVFDVHQLFKNAECNHQKLRLGFILYGIMGPRDLRKVNFEHFNLDEKELGAKLLPVLSQRKDSDTDEFSKWFKEILGNLKPMLGKFSCFDEKEKLFLDNFYHKNQLDLGLLTSDELLIKNAHEHPLIKWRMTTLDRDKQRS